MRTTYACKYMFSKSHASACVPERLNFMRASGAENVIGGASATTATKLLHRPTDQARRAGRRQMCTGNSCEININTSDTMTQARHSRRCRRRRPRPFPGTTHYYYNDTQGARARARRVHTTTSKPAARSVGYAAGRRSRV